MRTLLLATLLSVAACGDAVSSHGRAAHDAAPSPAQSPKTNFTGVTWGNPTQRGIVKGYIQKLTDEPRSVPGYNETRGGAGAFEALPGGVVEEYISSIIACSERFLPSSLPDEQKWALVACDISAESAFKVGTSGMNTNPSYGVSGGGQQVTPSIWNPMFQKRANIVGLTHYDGKPWVPADTTMDMPATSIWDNMHIANWAISEQAKSCAGNPGAKEHGEDVGSCPATWWTGLYCWVSGYPACRSNGDKAQSDHYRAMQTADLNLLGLPASLLDTSF